VKTGNKKPECVIELVDLSKRQATDVKGLVLFAAICVRYGIITAKLVMGFGR